MSMIGKALTFCVAITLLSPSHPEKSRAGVWDSWQFLLGEWRAEGGGQPGQGAGNFSFSMELQGKILVRRNRVDYTATKDHPAFTHEDLMVIYPDAGDTGARAVYFDNEGHVIHYRTAFSEDRSILIFVSDPVPTSPRFRLTYMKGDNGTLKIRFEIAPPDKPDVFSTYVEGTARRQERH